MNARDDSSLNIDSARIAVRCPVRWESMTGAEAKRFCALCNLHVHDFSQMTREEARGAIEASGGRLCGRIQRRSDGSIIFKDGGTTRRTRRWIAGAKLAAIPGFVFAALLGMARLRANLEPPRGAASVPAEKLAPNAQAMPGRIGIKGGVPIFAAPIRITPSPTATPAILPEGPVGHGMIEIGIAINVQE